MIFGFKNTPEHFQITTKVMFGNLVDNCALVYLDDILTILCNKVDHEEHVCIVFERIA